MWWYSNEKKRMEGTHKDGKQEGRWTWWGENGKKAIECMYKDGQPKGDPVFYDD